MRGVEVESGWIAQLGSAAPDFELPVLLSGVKARLRLRDQLKHHKIVLAFYPGNWENVSAQQMQQYQAERAHFKEQRAEVIGICVDSIMNTTVWERAIGPIDFPLCSDFWPHGAVSSAYGVFRQDGCEAGHCDRAIVVVSRSESITFLKSYAQNELPPLSETWEALRAA